MQLEYRISWGTKSKLLLNSVIQIVSYNSYIYHRLAVIKESVTLVSVHGGQELEARSDAMSKERTLAYITRGLLSIGFYQSFTLNAGLCFGQSESDERMMGENEPLISWPMKVSFNL